MFSFNHLNRFEINIRILYKSIVSFDSIQNQKPLDKIVIHILFELEKLTVFTSVSTPLNHQLLSFFICLFIEDWSRFINKVVSFKSLPVLYVNNNLTEFSLSKSFFFVLASLSFMKASYTLFIKFRIKYYGRALFNSLFTSLATSFTINA